MNHSIVSATVLRSPRRNPEVECDNCGLHGLCRIAGLDTEESLLEKVVSRRKPVARDTAITWPGKPFDSIYAVKSGAFKMVSPTGDGEERVLGFYFPGELIGLESLDSAQYVHSVVALDNSSVCELDFENLKAIDSRIDQVQHELIHAMSRRLLHDLWIGSLLGTQNAEQRVAAFLLSVSARFSERGLPALRFRLPMSREDTANYLGLAVETVSRMFKQFRVQEIVVARGRQTEILNLERLEALAGIEPLTADRPAEATTRQ